HADGPAAWEPADDGHASGAGPGAAPCGYRYAVAVPTPCGSLRRGKATLPRGAGYGPPVRHPYKDPLAHAGHEAQRTRVAASRRWSVRGPTHGRHAPGYTACPWRARGPGSSSRPPVRERAAGLKPSNLLTQELNFHGRLAQLFAQAAKLTVTVIERLGFHRLLASREERLTPGRETGGGEPEFP